MLIKTKNAKKMDIMSRWAKNMSVSQKSSMKSLDITSAYRRRTGQ
jgi:hypothetical protein